MSGQRFRSNGSFSRVHVKRAGNDLQRFPCSGSRVSQLARSFVVFCISYLNDGIDDNWYDQNSRSSLFNTILILKFFLRKADFVGCETKLVLVKFPLGFIKTDKFNSRFFTLHFHEHYMYCISDSLVLSMTSTLITVLKCHILSSC